MKKNIFLGVLLVIVMSVLSYVVLAADPTISTPVISPTIAYTANDLTCNATGVVPELDTNTSLTIEWFWYKGTEIQSSGNLSDVVNNTNTQIATIANALTTRADVWNCTVRATNGTAWSAFDSAKLTIQDTLPAWTQVATAASLYHSQDLSLQLNATDADTTDTLTWAVDNSMVSISASGLVTDNPTQAQVGNYSLMFNVTDGELVNNMTITYEIMNQPPVFTQAAPDVSLSHSVNFNSSINITDADSDTLTYYLNDTMINIVSSTGYLSDNPTQAQAGVYSIKVNATDGWDWVSDVFTYTITNAAPAFTQDLTTVTLYHSTNLNITLNATDADGDTLTYYVNNTMVNIVPSTGYLSDNAVRTDTGTHAINVNVTDGASWDSFVWNYVVQNRAPAWTQIPANMSVYVNEPWSIQINATDADGDTITWGVNTTTKVAITQSGVFSNKTMVAGVNQFIINITDGTDTSIMDYKLTQLATPVWAAISDYSGTFAASIYWLDLQDYYSGNTTAPTFTVSSSTPTSITCVLAGSLATIQVISGAPAAGTCTFSATEGTHPIVTDDAVSITISGVSGGTGGGANPYVPPVIPLASIVDQLVSTVPQPTAPTSWTSDKQTPLIVFFALLTMVVGVVIWWVIKRR